MRQKARPTKGKKEKKAEIPTGTADKCRREASFFFCGDRPNKAREESQRGVRIEGKKGTQRIRLAEGRSSLSRIVTPKQETNKIQPPTFFPSSLLRAVALDVAELRPFL